MSLFALFFQERAKIGLMELDASLNETHEAAAEITQNEIEDGSKVADHIVLKNRKLTIEGFVSKTPLGAAGLAAAAVTAAAGLAINAAGGAGNGLAGVGAMAGIASVGGLVANSFGPDGPKSREPKDVHAYLIELRDKRQPIDVQTGLELYKNMAVALVSEPRNVKNGGGLRFTVSFEQIRIVEGEDVTLTGVVGGAGKAADLGKQAAKKAGDAAEKGSSILFKVGQAAGAL